MLRWRSALVVLLLAGCGAALVARQQQAVSSSLQPLTSGTAAIVVDAVVHDRKGNPVTDLRKEDFVLLEDGVPQPIGDLTVVNSGLAATGRTVNGGLASSSKPGTSRGDAPPAGPSFMAIVFDRLSPEARFLSYKGALACLDTMQPTDYVGIFLADLRLTTIQPYTNDREKLRAAIKEVASRATSVFDRTATKPIGPKSESEGDDHASVPVVASPEFVGRPVDTRGGSPDHGPPSTPAAGNAWEIMARDEQGYATTDALIALTANLGKLPGRKSVVFFAEGLSIPDAVLPHFRDVVTTANRGNVSVYTIDGLGLRVHSKDAETGREIRAMGAAGLAVNPDGSNGSSLGMMERNEDVLRKDPRTSLTLLAQQTGGFLVENTNDLAAAFRQVDADRRSYYLITYAPRNSMFDGKWRSITVTVPGRKVAVRARSGYLAVRTPAGVPLLAYEGPALAALDRTPAPTDLPLRSAALVFPGGRLALLAATDAAALAFERDDKAHTYRTDFTILARIVDGNGEIVRKASQPYRLKGPAEQMDQARRGEILFFRQPSLAPGRYTLEVALHDALTMRSSVQRTAFVIEESLPGSLQISSLMLVERAERVTPEDAQRVNPLHVGDALLYPSLGQPIHKDRQKTLALYAQIVPAAGAAPIARLEVLRDGASIAEAPASLPAPDAAGRVHCLAQLSIDALPPARYTLRLIVTQGDHREARDVPFEVVP